MSEDLRAVRDRLARVLGDAQEETAAAGEARADAIAAADAWRTRNGLPPLVENLQKPELKFYERARALGLLRRVQSPAD